MYDPTADVNNTWDHHPRGVRSGDPTKLNRHNPLMHPEWNVGLPPPGPSIDEMAQMKIDLEYWKTTALGYRRILQKNK